MISSTQKKYHIMLGLSGGVDSSVAAYLLKKAGHHVEAIFMKNWEEEKDDGYCPQQKDFTDAEAICDQLNIPLHFVNFADQYWEKVFSHFLAEYRAGRTPNPDILCNQEIKFKSFLDLALTKGADFIATGHYAQRKDANGIQLCKAVDENKDQTYFLHRLNQQQLNASLFPIGHLTKSLVRNIATELGFINHQKKDSTGICFIGERKFKHFLNEFLPAKPGLIESMEGEVLGQHDGLMFYTIGQRKGLQIGGRQGKQEAPWYVARKDLLRNVLVVVQGDHAALYHPSLIAEQMHWIQKPTSFSLQAKIRYRQADQLCQIQAINDDQYKVIFASPQRAITSGQSIVFYQGDICLGGGIIR